MFSTIVVTAILLCTLFASVLLWSLLLKIGLRWSKASNVTTPRIVRTTVFGTLGGWDFGDTPLWGLVRISGFWQFVTGDFRVRASSR